MGDFLRAEGKVVEVAGEGEGSAYWGRCSGE